jgi:hypothetical protein
MITRTQIRMGVRSDSLHEPASTLFPPCSTAANANFHIAVDKNSNLRSNSDFANRSRDRSMEPAIG